jgi:hypothetical protein
MKKILLVLFFATASYGQVNFVRTTPQASVQLTTLADIDTILFLFPKSLTAPVFFDSTKAAKSVIVPAQDFVSAQGKFTLYLTRAAITGTADSFRVWVKKLMPSTGIPVRNDSTFIIGSASTFADIINHSQYAFTITDPTKGLALVFRKGDGGTPIKVRLNAWIDFTQ